MIDARGAREIAGALSAQTPEVRMVILRSKHRNFCTGADLNWMLDGGRLSLPENRSDMQALATMYGALRDCPWPTVACVHGSVLGGGVGIASACDFIFSAPEAQFALPEIEFGLVPGIATPFIIARLGRPRFYRWALEGNIWKAEEAAKNNLIDFIGNAEQIQARLENFSARCRSTPPHTLRLLKKLARQSVPGDISAIAAEVAELRASPEVQDRLRIFRESRSSVKRG